MSRTQAQAPQLPFLESQRGFSGALDPTPALPQLPPGCFGTAPLIRAPTSRLAPLYRLPAWGPRGAPRVEGASAAAARRGRSPRGGGGARSGRGMERARRAWERSPAAPEP